MNTTGISIINSTNSELLGIIAGTLAQFDDYIQDAADKGIDNSAFVKGYQEMESHYFKIKKGSAPDRGSIRALAKHIFRLASTEIYRD